MKLTIISPSLVYEKKKKMGKCECVRGIFLCTGTERTPLNVVYILPFIWLYSTRININCSLLLKKKEGSEIKLLLRWGNAPQLFRPRAGHGVGGLRHDHRGLLHGQPRRLPGPWQAADQPHGHQRSQGKRLVLKWQSRDIKTLQPVYDQPHIGINDPRVSGQQFKEIVSLNLASILATDKPHRHQRSQGKRLFF